MRPGTLGRALGIGARLVSQRILPPAPAPPTPAEKAARSAAHVRLGETAGRHTRAIGENTRVVGKQAKVARKHAGGLARSLWNPFAHASSVLWYEVTGMFFALFACLFAQHVYVLRHDWHLGREHAHFIAYAVFTLVFGYFAASSFLRARRKNRRIHATR